MQMAIRIAIVKAGVSGIPVTRLKAKDKRGVAREKVVAVPANRANTAVRSMMRPKAPSTRFPKQDGKLRSISDGSVSGHGA